MDVILLRLFVDPGDEEDPPLNAPLRSWLSYLLSLYSLILTLTTTIGFWILVWEVQLVFDYFEYPKTDLYSVFDT